MKSVRYGAGYHGDDAVDARREIGRRRPAAVRMIRVILRLGFGSNAPALARRRLAARLERLLSIKKQDKTKHGALSLFRNSAAATVRGKATAAVHRFSTCFARPASRRFSF